MWQKERQLQLGIPYNVDNFIPVNEKGRAFKPNYVYNNFRRMISEAGAPQIRFHDLRHTHATIMLQMGEHPKVISERLGHSSIQMTMNTYSHVTFDMQKESSDRFEKVFLEKKITLMWSKCGKLTK